MDGNLAEKKKSLIQLHRKMFEGMLEKDIKKLDTILDKNYTLTHMTGYVQSRDEWLKQIKSEEMKYYSASEVDVQAELSGEKAVIVGKDRVKARIWGMSGTWNLLLTTDCIQRNGKWIALKTVATTF